jgi:glycosyltransferase involved in cell wall biosynthesis
MITIVSPWYGPDTTGGAETQARSLARALHAIGVEVRVWSSTGRDSFHPGDDAHYSAGHSSLDDIPLWRFRPTPTDERGIPHFFRQHPDLLPPVDSFPPHELRLLGSLLGSDELYAAILAERSHTHFIFLPYPFPTTFWGALLATERSFVLPCLHDEPYARYSTYRYMFTQVRGVLANSHPEAHLIRWLYDLPAAQVHVPGEGIDLAPRGDGAAFRRAYGLDSLDNGAAQAMPLLLYVGRRDESKNISLLLAYTREYWARRGQPFRLLLAGRGDLEIPASLDARRNPDAPLLDIGFVEQQTKHDAYAAADVFVQPSQYESFSIVLMEAWLQSTPALVYNACNVTADHCQRSGGGLAFGDFGTFAAALDTLLAQSALRQTLGSRGRDYVLATCDWSEVARRTAAAMLDTDTQRLAAY